MRLKCRINSLLLALPIIPLASMSAQAPATAAGYTRGQSFLTARCPYQCRPRADRPDSDS